MNNNFPTTKKIRPFPKTMLAPLGATQTAVPRPICSLARSVVDPRLAAARSDPFRKTLKVSAPETACALIRTDQSVSAFRVSCLDPRVRFMLNHQPLLQPKAIRLAAAAQSHHRRGGASCRPRPSVAQHSVRGRLLRCRPKFCVGSFLYSARQRALACGKRRGRQLAPPSL